MCIRRELGGYCPKDPLKFEFMSSIILGKDKKIKSRNTEGRLRKLIKRSSK